MTVNDEPERIRKNVVVYFNRFTVPVQICFFHGTVHMSSSRKAIFIFL